MLYRDSEVCKKTRTLEAYHVNTRGLASLKRQLPNFASWQLPYKCMNPYMNICSCAIILFSIISIIFRFHLIKEEALIKNKKFEEGTSLMLTCMVFGGENSIYAHPPLVTLSNW